MAKGTRAKLKRLYQHTYELLNEKWLESHEETSILQRFGQFWVLVFKSFGRNRCPLRATALAYTTLLALVPLLAVVLSITSSLLQEKGESATKQMIERFVDAAVPQLKLLPPDPISTNAAAKSATNAVAAGGETAQTNAVASATNGPPEIAAITPQQKVVNYIYEFIANIKVKTLGATGMAGLIMIAIMLLSTIEGTFNDIWGVTHGRSWPRRVVQYWAAISLGPIVLALAVLLAGNTYSTSADHRIYVKFRDGFSLRVDDGKLMGDLRARSPNAEALIKRLETAGALWQPQRNVPKEARPKVQRREKGTPVANAFILLVPTGLNSAEIVSELTALDSVEAAQALPDSWLGRFVVWILPVVYISIAFALFYKLMPNTQVHFRAAVMGGLVGGSLWLFLNLFNTFFLTRIITFSKIYGTALALLPIFLLGLYFSWWIMLFGAQVAYAFQNRTVYVQEKRAESVSQSAREYIAMRIMVYVAKRFERGDPPPTVLETATDLAVPSRLVGRVLQPLMDARLVLEVALEKDHAYAPARPIENITCYDILNTLRGSSGVEPQTRDDGMRELVCAEFDRIRDAERRAALVSLKDIVDRIGDQDLKHEQVTRSMVEAMEHR
jgi:uncharacterized BrkB/YihY/UPF0761 family membrane protein/DNA-binding IscR family transcriptional regulator